MSNGPNPPPHPTAEFKNARFGNVDIDRADLDSRKFRRTYVACLNCRVRKVKCDLGSVNSPRDRCVRCTRERRDCVFVDSKKRKLGSFQHDSSRQNSAPLVSPRQLPSLGHEIERDLHDLDKNEPKHFSTMDGALVFLANAAGKIASADERDHIDAREKHSQLEASSSYRKIRHNSGPIPGVNDTYFPQSTDSHAFPYTKTSCMNKSVSDAGLHGNGKATISASAPLVTGAPFDSPFMTLNNASESHATHTEPTNNPSSDTYNRMSSYIPRQIFENERLTMPPAENSYSARPERTSVLSEIEYIGEHGILNATEAQYLIEMFFLTMHPFFPHIPQFLQSPKALSGYPILLCAILTISSRYHSLENQDHLLAPKNIEVHDRLWLYVQRLISQTVWAEASTRSIGTVFAFLLFTEWNPRAIHWRWSDYANRAEDAADTKETDLTSATDEPAGLGAMRRSYRMAWMLIGSAVRLAQDTGFMELSSKTYLATHVAEINSVMNMKRRSMLSHSLAELDMDTAEISEAEMEAREDNEIKILGLSEDICFPENSLQFTEVQKAQIELLQITSVGHESLYGYKAQLGSLSQRQNLSILNFMSFMINNWSRRYRKFLVPSKIKQAKRAASENFKGQDSKATHTASSGIENESFIFEFNYIKLYIYSLALSPSPKSREGSKNGKTSLKLDEISKSAKYIEQAFNAANEILQVAHRVHKLKMLRFMPVRWVTRIVRAVAFIVKCYLTITAHKSAEVSVNSSSNMDHFDATILSLSLISVEEIVQSIQKAAITLRDCSPDELHLCTRYSNVLLYLYSEMKTTLRNYTGNNEDMEDSGEKQHSHSGTRGEDGSEESHSFSDEKSAVSESSKGFPDIWFPGDSEVMDWFINNRNVGLDFVGPWTELIEQQIDGQNLNMDHQLNLG